MDIKRVLTSIFGLPIVIAILVFGNTTVIDVFFAVVAIISIKEYFEAFEKGKTAKPIKWIGYVLSASIAILRLLHLQSSLSPVDQDMTNRMFALVICAFFIIFFHILNSGMKRNAMDRSCNNAWNNIYTSINDVSSNTQSIKKWNIYNLVCNNMWMGNRYICIFSRKVFWKA